MHKRTFVLILVCQRNKRKKINKLKAVPFFRRKILYISSRDYVFNNNYYLDTIEGSFLKILRKPFEEICYLIQSYRWRTCADLTSETFFPLYLINYHYFRSCFGCSNVSSACRIWILSLHWWLQYDPWSAFRGSLDRYHSYIT